MRSETASGPLPGEFDRLRKVVVLRIRYDRSERYDCFVRVGVVTLGTNK